jgi:3',5'-cyclic AMP phosphodiesterase CpdA
MPLQIHRKQDVIDVLRLLQEKVATRDALVVSAISAAKTDSTIADVHAYLESEIVRALKTVDSEVSFEGEAFHSRNPLAALSQALLNATANGLSGDPAEGTRHNAIGDAMPAVVNLFGEGNPIVWAPVMVNILLEHVKPKSDFRIATEEKSYIKINDTCKIALLGDWGADNDHAQRIAALVRQLDADIAIHLGDIYYSGNQYECERFLQNWPLKVANHNSFALNGNHEMYSRGIPYFETVLPAFSQEASYFTLYNENWQIHGLDTAYVPFSIDGTVPDAGKPGLMNRFLHYVSGGRIFENAAQPDGRLKNQWDWLVSKIAGEPKRKNIFLSHNQPISAYLAEYQAGHQLYWQFLTLQEKLPGGLNAVLAWFFGHEHKGTIYKDGDHLDFKARLIGNGAIPHSVQALVPPQRDESNAPCAAVYTMNNKPLAKDFLGIGELDLAVSTFALITLDGPNATVEYINEDGSLCLKENLSGLPNDVVEWGKGYGPLE